MIFPTVLILSALLLPVLSLSDIYNEWPKLYTRDSNLYIEAGLDRNVSFKAKGFYINNLDIIPTLVKANSALKTEESFQRSADSYQDRLNILEQKLLILEVGSKGGVSNSTVLSTLAISNYQTLNRRINMLRRRINTFRNVLEFNECISNPCKNGGTCFDLYNTFSCHCPNGWEGTTCETDVNECFRFDGTGLACQNGATCMNTPGSYKCSCKPGWFGVHCHARSNSCFESNSNELCGHGVCIPDNSNLGYKCLCDAGWTSDRSGTNPACNVDIDECKQNHRPCSTNPLVLCVNIPGSFACGACPTGYTGNGYYCADIDECSMFNGGCSMNPKVQCINTMGSRVCGMCPAGYIGNGQECTYKGICNVNNGGCHFLAQCKNYQNISPTFVECVCPSGYVGNGIGPSGCSPATAGPDPCLSNPCKNGNCSRNSITNDFVCSCERGFVGRTCANRINPCASNPCQNNGVCKQILAYYFKCVCPQGFAGKYCQTEDQACGGRLVAEEGVLKYPPADFTSYNHRVSCAWAIETNSSKVLNITFTHFNIEQSVGCRYDWLQIHDGRNSAAQSIGRFCGTQFPKNGTIVTTHNVVYLWFRSDRTVAKSGFQLNWTTVDPVCWNFVMVDSHGSIQSPGSPGNYPLNRDCTWLLVAPLKKRLLFNFFSLMIGDNEDCNHDYLEFMTGENSVFAKFCNTTHPAPIYSPGHMVTVHFHSDEVDSYPGFQITYSVVEGVPGCGGVYTSAVGEIHSPTIEGEYPPDMFCEYRITQTLKSHIKITFLSFDVEDSQGCTFDYVSIHEGSDSNAPLVGRYCGNVIPAPFISNKNVVTILFKTDWATSHAGFRLKFETVCDAKFTQPSGILESPNYPNKYEDGVKCFYEIIQKPGTIIELEFSDISFETTSHTDCLFDFIEIRDGDHANATLIGKYCKMPVPTILSTNNYLWIYFKSDFNIAGHGFRANYSTKSIGCGGILKESIGTIVSPSSTPNNYPAKISCSWVISAPKDHVIQLAWMTFQLELSFDCHYDNILIFDNNTGPGLGGLMGKYCGSTPPPTLISSSNLMTVIFTSDSSINAGGFLATYSFIQERQVCGGNYVTAAGWIKSPGYPGNYPVEKRCVWIIKVDSGRQILLNITDFNIEHYVNCRYDWLEIRNGGTAGSPLIGRYCGTKIPKTIPSHANQLYLEFHSDMTKTGHGFKIQWTSTSTGCGGTLSSPSGSIISPHYPEPYARHTECYWKITTSAGSFIRAIFTDIDMEKHVYCSLDYVEIFDGLKLNSKSLGRYCEPLLTSYINSSSNQMLLKFRSDVSYNGRGFQMQYSTVCNNNLTGFSGVIESLNFPNNYPPNQNCEWTIEVSKNNKINITFSHFSIDQQPLGNLKDSLCIHHFLAISFYNTETEVYESYGKYCDENPLEAGKTITLNSNLAKIKFVSDNFVYTTGFRLEWKLFGCGGMLKKNENSFHSPNYPKPYVHDTQCNWLIEVESDKIIELKFVELDLETQHICDYDYVKIYDGIDTSGTELATICYQSNPSVITSTRNTLFVSFESDSTYHGKGFYAEYSAIDAKCGGKMTSVEGKVFSPNYPNNYKNNITCGWLIEVPEQFRIEIKFKDVDLLPNNKTNYIKIFDGPYASYPIIANISGHTTPNNTFKSTYNQVYIEFKAHSLYTSKGFLLEYRKACGARITTSGSGVIQASNKDTTIDYSESCTWIITSSVPSQRIALTINQNNYIGERYDECEKEISVYNGESSDAPLLGEYCRNHIPPTIFSDGSTIKVAIDNKHNFFATYSVVDDQCGGTLSGWTGTFSTPGYPTEYAQNMRCEWTIDVSPGYHVSLTFSDFQLLDSEHCNPDYLEIRKNNASGELLGVYCGNNIPTNITHLGSLWILYKGSNFSSPDVTAKGFLAEFSWDTFNILTGYSGTITSPFYPRKFESEYEHSWKIVVQTGKRIRITFIEMDLENFMDDYYHRYLLEIFDGPDETSKILKYVDSLSDPITSSTNIVYIKLPEVDYNPVLFKINWMQVQVQNEPTKITYNVTGCGSKETININHLRNFTLISPGYPNGYAKNLLCQWIFSTTPGNHLTITFKDISFQDYWGRHLVRGPCYLTKLAVYNMDVDDNDWRHIQDICYQNGTYDNHLATTNLMKVVFTSDRYFNGSGFKADIREECGGTLTGPSGYITFDNTTIRSFDCRWNITVKAGRTIKVTFLKFLLGKSEQCYSYLMFRNGIYKDSPLLGNGKYCGYSEPGEITTTSNSFSVAYSGFKSSHFKIRFQEVSVECGGEITLETANDFIEISSPNYPNIPLPYSECRWLIKAPAGENLKIDFVERFDLASSILCAQEYVDLKDGATELAPLIGRYCGVSIPDTAITKNNMLFIKYFTNNEEPQNGFKANITIGDCGGTISGFNGIINYDFKHTSGRRKNCTWYIEGAKNFYLNLEFQQFSLGPALNCSSSNHLVISEINKITNITTQLAVFCGNRLPPKRNSTMNKVKIDLINVNNRLNDQHFKLKFRSKYEDCGGELNSPSGFIKTPGYPLPPRRNMFCEWHITVPKGRRVTLKLLDADAADESIIMVSNGNSALDRIKTIKQKVENMEIDSSDNSMSVSFWYFSTNSHRGFWAKFTSDKPSACIGDFNQDSGMIYSPNLDSYTCTWSRTNPMNHTLSLTVDLNSNWTLPYCLGRSKLWIKFGQEEISICLPTKQKIIRTSYPLLKMGTSRLTSRWMNFSIFYQIHNCGGILTSEMGSISSPNFPNSPGKKYECAWLINLPSEQTVKLNITSNDFGTNCDNHYLLIYNGGSPSSPRIGKYCTNNKIEIFTSGSNKLWLEYKFENYATGKGFNLTYEPVISGCGGIFHDSTRIIETPGYSQNKDYPKNTECIWEVHGKSGYFITVSFLGRFFIETSSNCTDDYVEILDYRNNKWISLKKNCGRNMPPNIQSTGSKIRIVFRSGNNSITATGFRAKWFLNCGGTFLATDEPQYIKSPGYPNKYVPSLNCVYNITNPAKVINVRFDEFELEADDPGCKYDNVTIKGRYSSTVTTYCGTEKPGDLRIKDLITVTFKTDTLLQKRGFTFMYKNEVCGGNITEPGIVKSPGLSISTTQRKLQYNSEHVTCKWEITAPSDKVVVLRIQTLKLPHRNCLLHSLKIFSGRPTENNNNRLAVLCGDLSKNPPVIKSPTNQMFLIYTYNAANYDFSAEVDFTFGPKSGCGGTININQNNPVDIKPPNDLEDVDCHWLLQTQAGNAIRLHLKTINLPNCLSNATNSECPCGFIEIRDGPAPYSNLIEKICSDSNSQNNPRILYTNDRFAHVRYYLEGKQNNAFDLTVIAIKTICGTSVLNVTKHVQTLSSPFYPAKYPNELKCVWKLTAPTSTDIISLHFIDFDLKEENGSHITSNICKQDKLVITDNFVSRRDVITEGLGPTAVYSGKSPFLRFNTFSGEHMFCGRNQKVFDYYSPSNSLTIQFQSGNSENRGRGFMLEYFIPGCGRNFTSEQGRVVERKPPFGYCQMIITAPTNYTISLYFKLFMIPMQADCVQSGIEIRDGGTATGSVILKSCGYRIPNSVYSTKNSLWIKTWNTNSGIVSFMYDFTYTSSPNGQGCGGELYNYKGVFTSPMYPNDYKANSKCTWNIRVPLSLKLALRFLDLDFSGGCSDNHIKVTTYINNVPSEHKFCGTDNVATLYSDNRIIITYTTTPSNTGRGFRAIFQGVSDDALQIF